MMKSAFFYLVPIILIKTYIKTLKMINFNKFFQNQK